MPSVPKHRELLLPLLDILRRTPCRGPATLRRRLLTSSGSLQVEAAPRKKFGDGQETNVFQRRVRSFAETALVDSLILNGRRGVWELGERGHKALTFARPGVVGRPAWPHEPRRGAPGRSDVGAAVG